MLKKQYEKAGFTKDEINDIKEAYILFNPEKGKIHPQELRTAMEHLGFHKKNPSMYKMIMDLQQFDKEIEFDDFMSSIMNRLGDRDSPEGVKKMFELFVEDGNDTIRYQELKNAAKELGETMNSDELLDMLEKVAINGKDITLEDFKNVLNNKTI